jgi:TadE-like protein
MGAPKWGLVMFPARSATVRSAVQANHGYYLARVHGIVGGQAVSLPAGGQGLVGRPSPRREAAGQSMLEFALVLPILLMMFIAIADFGRIFAAMITLESATRNAAEAAANQYLATPPATLNVAAPTGDPAFYSTIHAVAARVVCNDMRGQPNTNFDAGTATCPDMPLVMVCVHDSQDTNCSSLASPGSAPTPAECTGFSPAPTNDQGAAAHPRPRWVEVRTCYKFTAILNAPLFNLGDFWIQRSNDFTIPCYFALGSDECGDS